MNATTVAETTFDGLRAWELTSANGATAVVAARGATLVSWDPGVGQSIIAGFDSAAELESFDGGRCGILVPFAGRIKQGTFTFGKERVELPVEDDGHARHGFVYGADFDFVRAGSTLQLRYSYDGSGPWPWTFDLEVIFALDEGDDGLSHLTVQLNLTNTAGRTAPAGLGWHPLMRFPGMRRVDNIGVTIPARTEIATSRDLIPLDGEAAYSGIHAPVNLPYLGQRKFDTVFTSLVTDEDGVVRSTMREPVTGATITLTQEPAASPYLVAWTADSAKREPRGGFAMEPYSHMPDSLNRSDSAAAMGLADGATRSMTATLTYRSR